MKWIQLKLETTFEALDAISYALMEMGIQGVEIQDNQPLSEEDKKQMYVDLLDEPILQSEHAYITFYLSEEENIEEKLQILQAELNQIKEYIPIGTGNIIRTETEETDWADNWKKYFKPFRVDHNIIIKPSWESLTDQTEEDIVIEIDPGMAFGSGTHETTSLCLQLLNKHLEKEMLVYDVGCGSGILGIAASKLGAKEVGCIDIDINAVVVAKENIALNNVAHNVSVVKGNLLEEFSTPADLIVANILAEVIVMLIPDVRQRLTPKGYFITSGIIEDKIKLVTDTLEQYGFNVEEIARKGEWAAITAVLGE